jgi:hypothetical protein
VDTTQKHLQKGADDLIEAKNRPHSVHSGSYNDAQHEQRMQQMHQARGQLIISCLIAPTWKIIRDRYQVKKEFLKPDRENNKSLIKFLLIAAGVYIYYEI